MTRTFSSFCALLSLASFHLLAGAPQQNPEKALEEALKMQRASLEKQRQAIQLQLAEKGSQIAPFSPYPVEQFIVPSLTPSQPDCPALDSGRITALVSAAAQRQSLDPALLKAVMKQESGFKPCAVSPMGAQGLMQLMPATARELHVKDVFDPSQNVHAGAAYLKELLERYKGDLRLALVGYNAGPGRADQAADTPYPLETQNYVASILADLGIDSSDAGPVKEDLAPSDEPYEGIDMNPPVVPANSKGRTQQAQPRL